MSFESDLWLPGVRAHVEYRPSLQNFRGAHSITRTPGYQGSTVSQFIASAGPPATNQGSIMSHHWLLPKYLSQPFLFHAHLGACFIICVFFSFVFCHSPARLPQRHTLICEKPRTLVYRGGGLWVKGECTSMMSALTSQRKTHRGSFVMEAGTSEWYRSVWVHVEQQQHRISMPNPEPDLTRSPNPN